MTTILNKACSLKSLPETLYHYTTPAGFKGILESGVLRATHVAYTNDAVEHLHASQILKLRVQARRNKNPAERVSALLDAMERGLDHTTSFNTLPVGISCFCESQISLANGEAMGWGRWCCNRV